MMHISSLAEFPRSAADLRPTHVISMLADDDFPETPPGVAGSNHLRLTFDDIDGPLPGHVPPSEANIERLLEFGQLWDLSGPLISHCFAGISRSSAAALILLAQHNPGREGEFALLMRGRGPHIQPNRLMIELADGLLECGGRLTAAVDAMGPADPFSPWRLVSLPARVP